MLWLPYWTGYQLRTSTALLSPRSQPAYQDRQQIIVRAYPQMLGTAAHEIAS